VASWWRNRAAKCSTSAPSRLRRPSDTLTAFRPGTIVGRGCSYHDQRQVGSAYVVDKRCAATTLFRSVTPWRPPIDGVERLGVAAASDCLRGDRAWTQLVAVRHTGSCLPWRHSRGQSAGRDFRIGVDAIDLVANGFVGYVDHRRTARRARTVCTRVSLAVRYWLVAGGAVRPAGDRVGARFDLRRLAAFSESRTGVDQANSARSCWPSW
jgi:hypothetical protein